MLFLSFSLPNTGFLPTENGFRLADELPWRISLGSSSRWNSIFNPDLFHGFRLLVQLWFFVGKFRGFQKQFLLQGFLLLLDCDKLLVVFLHRRQPLACRGGWKFEVWSPSTKDLFLDVSEEGREGIKILGGDRVVFVVMTLSAASGGG